MEMTSKEALEIISNHKCYEKECSCWDYISTLYKNEIQTIKQDLERKEQLEKENQELKEKNTKMFVELSNTITVYKKLLEYLDKDKTKLIAKYSLKETLFKITDKVVNNE